MTELEGSLNALACRGPDGRGAIQLENHSFRVLLGHTRLAIIDLTSDANQPSSTIDGRFHLVFNGEIYNYVELRHELEKLGHVFRTTGDTEVLLAALTEWGEKCLDRLEGMFAFAFLDLEKNLLLLARDRFGIKPLYWHFDKVNRLTFGSEISALLPLISQGAKANEGVVKAYLVFGWHDYSKETFFHGVETVPPAHFVRFDLSREPFSFVATRWWQPSIAERFDGDFPQAASHLRALILESVALHMRSDVPVGAALSGGVDSSTLVSTMRYLYPQSEIHTFSFIDRNPEISEEKWVDLVSEHCATRSHKTSLSKSDLFSPSFQDMIRYQGEPFGSSSIFAQYKVFELAGSEGIKVTLDGQGADELFAGYDGYPEHRIPSLIESGQIGGAMRLAKNWATWPGRDLTRLFISSIANLSPELGNSTALMNLGTKLGLIPPQGAAMIRGTRSKMPTFGRTDLGTRRRLAEELRFSMGQKRLHALLRVADRNSMRWSVESRVPFLNTAIAEFVLSLPEEFLLNRTGETKHILRHAMRGIVPDQVLDRRDKIGFKADDRSWLVGNLDSHKLISGLEQIKFINMDIARAHVRGVSEGQLQFSDLTWRLINLSAWAESKSVITE